MITQCITVGLLTLFSAMLPGPDFAIVTKNTLLHSRRSGIFTSLGIGSAILIHMTYCALGLAIIIYDSLLLFNIIKYIGSAYLIYLGITSLLSKIPEKIVTKENKIKKLDLSPFVSFRQGFLCNLLNPKATLFFLALFTMVIKPNTPFYWMVIYSCEIVLVAVIWFSMYTYILSHPRVTNILERAEKYIAKLLGIFLIFFGTALAFVSR
ncbi:MAG: LysE family translocator [Gammaproteobacteria bacterium]|nr:LysE family translocator [Gammaproteobacteria bacterium]